MNRFYSTQLTPRGAPSRNRSLSIRSKKDGSSGGASDKSAPKHRFTMARYNPPLKPLPLPS